MSAVRTVSTLLTFALLAAPAVAGPKDDRIEKLEQQVAALEQKLDAQETLLTEQFRTLTETLNRQFAALDKKLAEAVKSDADRDREASALLAEVNQLVAQQKYDAARAKMRELQSQYGSTQTARRAQRIQQELAVFGKAVPKDLGIEQWYQGNVDIANGKPTLLVFWEVWCPHCKREVPKLQEVYSKFQDRGLQLVGLTKLTKSATEEKVRAFLKEQSVTYPIAKENGSASRHFNVSGIPAAAVIKDGKILWRGHPARLTNAMLEGWL